VYSSAGGIPRSPGPPGCYDTKRRGADQFEIALKDFWPDHQDAMFITDRDRGTTTMISSRLYAKLRAHADDNQLPLHSVVQQLRAEIHQS
jgi:hypothetical protein